MSRKPVSNNNQDAIKALAKREGNNICADCKRNKCEPSKSPYHEEQKLCNLKLTLDLSIAPRWASWNRGVFICIRYVTDLNYEGRGWTIDMKFEDVPGFIVEWVCISAK